MKEKQIPLMEVNNLKMYYPVSTKALGKGKNFIRAVDDISFQIYQGETLGLVGESGCGKSTIGNLLVELEQPTSGTVIKHCNSIEVQMVFQDAYSSLNPRKQIREILSYPMIYHKVCSAKNADSEVKRLLELVGLPQNAMDRYAYEFSGGQRQRIGIAKALSLNPKLIVCDEPVSALDVSIQAQILNLFQDIQTEIGVSYLFIGHGLDAVNYISDRIAVMYLGKIVEIADARELSEHPVHPYTKALYSSAPIPNPRKRDRERILLEGEIPSSISLPGGCRFRTRCPYACQQCIDEEPALLPTNKAENHLVACIYREDEKWENTY